LWFNDSNMEGKEIKSKQKKSKKRNKNFLVVIIILLFSTVGLFFTAKYLLPRALVYLTQAAKPSKYSLSNSYLFGAPLSAVADGQTKIRVSAFLLNDEGRGVPEKQISLDVVPKGETSGSPQVKDVQPVTDKFGKAVFEVSSTFSGQYVATGVVDGMEIPQTVTLTFK